MVEYVMTVNKDIKVTQTLIFSISQIFLYLLKNMKVEHGL